MSKILFTDTQVKKLHRKRNVILNKNSDQGVHYTSRKFHNLLKKYNIGQSMSRRGNYRYQWNLKKRLRYNTEIICSSPLLRLSLFYLVLEKGFILLFSLFFL